MSSATCAMAERFDRRMVQDWVQSVEEARRSCIPEPSEDSDWGLSSSPDIPCTTPGLLSSQSKTLQATHTQRQKPPTASSQSQASASSAKIVSEANVNVHCPPAQPPMPSRVYMHLREKSQSPLPEPTCSPELPPFDPVGISREHPKSLIKRALTYGGASTPPMPHFGSTNLLRACTSPDLRYQTKSAPTSPNLNLHSRRSVVVQKKGGGGKLTRSYSMLCKSSSETNLANVNINISLASSVEGLSGSSRHSGELACDHDSSHYNVSPVHSDSEMGGGYDNAVMEAAMPTFGSSSQTSRNSGRKGGLGNGHGDGGGGNGHGDGGGQGGSMDDLPPLRQEELAVVSMSVGGRLPHLTLLLGMEYAEYENIASTVESSQGTQALKLLMRWYQSGKGDRWELAEALKMAGRSRIAKLLLQDELETLHEKRDQLPMLRSKRASSLSPSPPPSPSHSPHALTPHTLSPPSPVTALPHPVTTQQGKGISRQQLQKLEKMHTRSFAFEEDEDVWGKQDSKHRKFLSKRSTSASISASHPSYLLPRHILLEHGGSQDSAATRPMKSSRSSCGSLPQWGSSLMRLEKLQNFDSSMEKLTALSTSRGNVTPISPTFQQLPKPSLVHPLPETDVACELTATTLRFQSQLQTGTGKVHFDLGQKSSFPWQHQQQQEQTPELQYPREQPDKDHVSRQDSGIGTLSSTSRCDF